MLIYNCIICTIAFSTVKIAINFLRKLLQFKKKDLKVLNLPNMLFIFLSQIRYGLLIQQAKIHPSSSEIQ